MNNWKFWACLVLGVIVVAASTTIVMLKMEQKKDEKFLAEFLDGGSTPTVQGQTN